jgi:hypothetical protein
MQSEVPVFTAEDRDALGVYQRGIEDYQNRIGQYQSDVDSYNNLVNTYNRDLASWQESYAPYRQQYQDYEAAFNQYRQQYDQWNAARNAYNEAATAWNAGPRTTPYAGPPSPGTFTGTAPTAPEAFTGGEPPVRPGEPPALGFTEDEVQAYINEAQAYRAEAEGRAVPGRRSPKTAFEIFESESGSPVVASVDNSGTRIGFSFSGKGFAQGGVVPRMNQGIGSIFGR